MFSKTTERLQVYKYTLIGDNIKYDIVPKFQYSEL